MMKQNTMVWLCLFVTHINIDINAKKLFLFAALSVNELETSHTAIIRQLSKRKKMAKRLFQF